MVLVYIILIHNIIGSVIKKIMYKAQNTDIHIKIMNRVSFIFI